MGKKTGAGAGSSAPSAPPKPVPGKVEKIGVVKKGSGRV